MDTNAEHETTAMERVIGRPGLRYAPSRAGFVAWMVIAVFIVEAGLRILAPDVRTKPAAASVGLAGQGLLAPMLLPGVTSAPRALPQGDALADVAERVVSSVVNIKSVRVLHDAGATGMMNRGPFFSDPFFRQFFGGRRGTGPRVPLEQRQQSLGSGVIVGEDGIVLTNNHVIDGADEIAVSLADDREFAAEVVGSDPKTDLAVLRLKGDVGKLTPLHFGDSSKLRLGEVVLAIGNPFGVGRTVTMGIVSATGRANMGIADYEDFIQTDAAINPGNSGGALVDTRGNLVGINTAILSRTGGYQGIGFAIPSDMAKGIMDSLLSHGRVVRGWLGVAIQDLDKDLTEAMDLDGVRGVLVSDVTRGGPADHAGLERGDLIVDVDGEEMHSAAELRNAVAVRAPGSEVPFGVMHGGKRKQVRVTLGELPEKVADEDRQVEEDGMLAGLEVAPVDEVAREQFDLPSDLPGGVVITGVQQGSPAMFAGLRQGDVVLELNHKPVSSTREFRHAYDTAKRRVLALVWRQGRTFFLVLSKETR